MFCYLEQKPEVRQRLQQEIDQNLDLVKDDFMGKFDKEHSE